MRAVIGLVCAAGLLTGCSAAADPGASESSTPASARRPAAPATASAAPARARSAAQSWFAQVNPKVQRVEKTITVAQVAARRPDRAGLDTACRMVRTYVDAVQAAPRSPDAVIRNALEHEMTAFAHGADLCVVGRFEAAGHSIDVGHRYAEIVLRRLDIVVPGSRSTT